MRKLLFTLLALLLAAVAAFAGDTIGGGEGGAINLPGGRGQLGSGGGEEWVVSGKHNLRLRLPENMPTAVAVLQPYSVPMVQTLASVDGLVTIPLATINTLRASGETGFGLDLVCVEVGLRVDVRFRADGQLLVTAR